MQLMGRGIFHPGFTQEMAKPVYGGMTSFVTIRRNSAIVDPAQPAPVWNYDTGSYPDGSSDFSVLATGVLARLEPGQDFRARAYIIGNETTVAQSIEVTLPAAIPWVDGLDVSMQDVLDEDQIIVTRNFFSNLDALKRYILVVRNPVPSSTDGWRQITCDIDMKSGVGRVNS